MIKKSHVLNYVKSITFETISYYLYDCPVTFLTGEEFHSSLRNQEK